MVARGVIAKLIERHLAEAGRRIDVIYICSNQAIAKQNFSKLAIVGRESKAVTDRITTLPLHVGGLDEPVDGFDRGINIIPITPTTSLDLRSSVGRADERALLWWLFTDEALVGMKRMRSTGARRLFQPPVSTLANFEWVRKDINQKLIDRALWTRFIEHVDATTEAPDIRGELCELADAFRSERRLWAAPWRYRRIALVARLRRILAASCIHALEPDLVILDEFQRFPRLLDPSEPTGELAEQLFGYPDCKALLLSATPYRMFSRAQELEDEHYSDFMTTTRFLQADDERSGELSASMGRYRSALRRSGETGPQPGEGGTRRDSRGAHSRDVPHGAPRRGGRPQRDARCRPRPPTCCAPRPERPAGLRRARARGPVTRHPRRRGVLEVRSVRAESDGRLRPVERVSRASEVRPSTPNHPSPRRRHSPRLRGDRPRQRSTPRALGATGCRRCMEVPLASSEPPLLRARSTLQRGRHDDEAPDLLELEGCAEGHRVPDAATTSTAGCSHTSDSRSRTPRTDANPSDSPCSGERPAR